MCLVRAFCLCVGFVLSNGCSWPLTESIFLTYTVHVTDPQMGVFSVKLHIGNASDKVTLRSYVPDEHTPITNLEAFDMQGNSLGIVRATEERGYEGSTLSMNLFEIDNSEEGDITVTYNTMVGTKYAKHGRQPYNTHGYMNANFALVSGRNLFLLPDASIDSAYVNFSLPNNWQIAIPWPEKQGGYMPNIHSAHLKDELMNATISLGLLECETRTINNVRVSSYVYKGWDRVTKDNIVEMSFSAYRSVQELFGGDGDGDYVFSFVPKTSEGMSIYSSHWSNSQGLPMYPPTQERWIVVVENLIDRWIRFPPYRMVYSESDDFWLLDGIRRYFGLYICEKIGFLNSKRYLTIDFQGFMGRVAEFKADHIWFHKTQNVNPVSDVSGLYVDDSWGLKTTRRAVAPFVVRFLDGFIQEYTDKTRSLGDVLKYEYKKKRNLNFILDIKEHLGEPISKEIEYYLNNLHEIPMKLNISRTVPSFPTTHLPDKNSEHADTMRIVITGDVRGHLEHCGCKSNQDGGIARRSSVIAQYREKYKNLIVLDIGNMFPPSKGENFLSDLDKEELKVFLRSMNEMKYDFAAISTSELFFGYEFLKRNMQVVDFPFICANVLRNGNPIGQPFVSTRTDDYRVAFIGIFQETTNISTTGSYFFQDRTSDLEFLDPVVAISHYLPMLRKDNDFVFIVGNLEPDLIFERLLPVDGIDGIISRIRPNFDLYETENGLVQSSNTVSGFHAGKPVIFESNGLYGIDLFEIISNRDREIVALQRKRTRLHDDIQEDTVVRSIIDDLYSTVIDEDLRPLLDWDQRFGQDEYVGVQACAACHSRQYTQWKNTRHATAFNTLLDVRRQYQPKCVICHTTGMGYETGYKMGELKHHLINVQCEMCHGPGNLHVRNPGSKMIRSPKIRLCITCHDSEHSDFDPEEYYPKVVH